MLVLMWLTAARTLFATDVIIYTGQLNYTTFRPDGSQNLGGTYEFEVSVASNKWRIHLLDVEVQNRARRSMETLTVGFDGKDLFENKHFPRWMLESATNHLANQNAEYVNVRQSVLPVNADPNVISLWLAFIAGSHLKDQTSGSIPSMFVGSSAKTLRYEAQYDHDLSSLLSSIRIFTSGPLVTLEKSVRRPSNPQLPARVAPEQLGVALAIVGMTNVLGGKAIQSFTVDYHNFATTNSVSDRHKATVISIQHKQMPESIFTPVFKGLANINDRRWTGTNQNGIFYTNTEALSRSDPMLRDKLQKMTAGTARLPGKPSHLRWPLGVLFLFVILFPLFFFTRHNFLSNKKDPQKKVNI